MLSLSVALRPAGVSLMGDLPPPPPPPPPPDPDPIGLTETNGEFVITNGAGSLTITILAPAAYAGSYSVSESDLQTGPVNLVPPQLLGQGDVGATLDTMPGLWVFDLAAPEPTIALQWLRDGVAIPGATGPSYQVQAADAGAQLTLRETPSVGPRSATSTALAVASAAPSYQGSVERTPTLEENDSDIAAGFIPGAGAYVIAVACIGGGVFSATAPGVVTKLAEAQNSDRVTIAWFHVAATGAGDFTLTNAAPHRSFIRRLFLWAAGSASTTVRAMGQHFSGDPGVERVALSGLTVEDHVFAAAVIRGNSPSDIVFGEDMAGAEQDEVAIPSAHGAAVAYLAAPGADVATTITEAALAVSSTHHVLSTLALEPL